MQTLYLTSIEPRSGKTLIATALGQLGLNQGKRVNYIKNNGDTEDTDNDFVSDALGISKITINSINTKLLPIS